MGHEKRQLVTGIGKEIFDQVMKAMQPAEEASGPVGDEYDQLMGMIAEEATARQEAYAIGLRRKRLLQRLADDLFALRGRYNLGNVRPEDPSHNIAAAILESFGSVVVCLDEDGQDAIDSLGRTLQADIDNHGDPQEVEEALKYLASTEGK